jgi:sugar phosphate isomerase/epimerase
MRNDKWYISTINENAAALADKYGMGLEIAEYCTAWNMDVHFEETDKKVRALLEGKKAPIIHGPFNELFPCAIDLKVREIARERYRQIIEIAALYGANKIVLHAGYNPRLYYPQWYTEQTIQFWKEFINEVPDNMEICLENVFEETIDMFLDIVRSINDNRLRICIDIGHVNAYSEISVDKWISECAEYIGHFHLHNNTGEVDAHKPLGDGNLPMKDLLDLIDDVCEDATCTIESLDAEESVKWLKENDLI